MFGYIEVIGKFKLKDVLEEHTFKNDRASKKYSAYAVYTYDPDKKPSFINAEILIFGPTDNSVWNSLRNSWIEGRYKLTGVGAKKIYLVTSMSDIGIVLNTNQHAEQKEEQLASPDVKLSPDTLDYVDGILNKLDSEV